MALPRRKKLMLACGSAGLLITLAGALALFWSRRPNESYRPGQTVDGVAAELARDLPSDHPPVVFRDVADEAGVRFHHFPATRSSQLPEDMGSGLAWGDYDDDGHLDLFVANMAGPLTLTGEELSRVPAGNRLYHGRGDGTFADVTEDAGLGTPMFAMAAAWGDADGDGLLDLVVTGYRELRLYRNEANGRFADVTDEAGLGAFSGFWAGASWSDYDRDGDLDLYVCGYVQYDYRPGDAGRGTRQYQAVVPYTLNPSSYSPERNLLFRNEGDLSFAEVAETVGVGNSEGRSLAAAWVDFDEDGWPDLYVANDVSDNVMFRNRGDGSFEDVSHAAWVADYRGAMGIGVADWDADGDQDLFVTHWIAQENALYSNLKHAFGRDGSADAALRFMDVADMVGLGQIALDYVGWGAFFFDYDNDGRPDLFVANGSTFQMEETPSRLVPMNDQLFWNAGADRGFFEVGSASGAAFRLPRVSRGAAAADFDGDGDLDVAVVNHGDELSLLRNEGGNDNHWLVVLPRSRSGNRFGVGARVTVETEGSTRTAVVGSQPSYLSQLPYRAHFGLGRADRVERLIVLFPSGKRAEMRDVPADRKLVVWEPAP